MKLSTRPVVKKFKLSFDPTGETTMTAKQARTADVIAIANLFAETTRSYDDEYVGRIEYKQKWNHEEFKRECALRTLIELDLEDAETEQPLFRFKEGSYGPVLAMSGSEFAQAWGILPPELVDEIFANILEVNPQWGPVLKGE